MVIPSNTRTIPFLLYQERKPSKQGSRHEMRNTVSFVVFRPTSFDLLPYNPEDRISHCTLCFTVLPDQKLIMVQWETMKQHGFVPEQAKSVEHEARNGIRLCATHHCLFERYCYYIRWMPEVVF